MKQHPLIKICGITDPNIARDAITLGATYIGLVMYTKSKRYVPLPLANTIAYAVKKQGGIPVAVFVDADAKQMQMICDYCDMNTVQLHGAVSRKNHYLLPDTYQRIYVRPVNQVGIMQTDDDAGLAYLNEKRDKLLFD